MARLSGLRLLALPLLALLWVASDAAALFDEEKNALESPFWRPAAQHTHRPVIGMLTLPVTVKSQRKYGRSSFATSYVRWIEAGGARVVPIFYDSSPEELEYVLNRINGIVWTGGLVDFNPEITDPEGSKYLVTTDKILRHVIAENERGNFYPFWGTCLGFERMIQLLAGDPDGKTIIEDVDAENYGINLGFTNAGWLSRLFGGMSYELFKEVASPVGRLAFNNHGLGVHPTVLANSTASKFLKVLSVDYDRNGRPFVSTVEGRQWPLYGTQWHPEKSPWEWTVKYHMAHSEPAVAFSNYLGRYFVNECKYNKNKFENATAEAKMLIANWPSYPTGRLHGLISAYTEITFFDVHHPTMRRNCAQQEPDNADDGIAAAV